MNQTNIPDRHINEKLSFSLAIIFTLIVGTMSLSNFLKTNTTYMENVANLNTDIVKLKSEILKLEDEIITLDKEDKAQKEPKTPKSWLKNKKKDKKDKEQTLGFNNFQILLVDFVYFAILPTLIVTLPLIAFFFLVQITLRGMWFSVNESAQNPDYAAAASRLDRLAQFFYGLSFSLLVINLIPIANMATWLAGYALIKNFESFELYAVGFLGLSVPVWYTIRFFWKTFHERKTRSKLRTLLRLILGSPALIYIIAALIFLFIEGFNEILVIFIAVTGIPPLFFVVLRWSIGFVGRITGVFGAVINFKVSANTNSRHERLFAWGGWAGIATLLIIVILIDVQIVNSAHSLAIEVDKKSYTPNELIVITVTRGGLLSGDPKLNLSVHFDKFDKESCPINKNSNQIDGTIPYTEYHGELVNQLTPYQENIGTIKYFLNSNILSQAIDQSAWPRCEPVFELIAEHGNDIGSNSKDKDDKSKTYFKLLANR